MGENVLPNPLPVSVTGPDPLPVSIEDTVDVNVTNVDPIPVKVENQGQAYQDHKMVIGDYFSGFITRISTVPETKYRVVRTGNSPLIVESILTDIDYTSILDGEFTLSSRVYVDSSNTNEWSYSGGTAVKIGNPLNLELINKDPEFDMIVDPVIDVLTGNYDFIISFSQYYRDSSGNRDTLSGVDNSFFHDNRKLIIPANSEILIESITTGAAGNTGEIRSFINFIEPGEL